MPIVSLSMASIEFRFRRRIRRTHFDAYGCRRKSKSLTITGFRTKVYGLCATSAFERPAFSAAQWESYRAANQIFADAVIEETKGQPTVVFIQDYHLALLPRMLKDRNPNLIVAQFWHIPWPNREAFRVFPWKEELLDGMLGNDLLGFHLRYHCQNFLDTADRNVEAS